LRFSLTKFQGNFVGKIPSARAESIIKSGKPGEYILRESESKKGSYTCVVNVDGRAVNCPVRNEHGLFYLGVSKSYQGFMISYFSLVRLDFQTTTAFSNTTKDSECQLHMAQFQASAR
jgi:hypothetical protein